MTIRIPDAALEKLRQFKEAGLNTEQICEHLRSDGFSESDISSVRVLLNGGLRKRPHIKTITICEK